MRIGRDGGPEHKRRDALGDGADGVGEGRSANLQVRQTGGPLLGAAARVGADPRGPIAVRVGVSGLLDVVPGRHLPGVGQRTGG